MADSGLEFSNSFNQTIIKVLNLENLNLDTRSEEYQSKVKEYIKNLENFTHKINELQLFSTNETLEDIQTNYIKYLLTPAFLGFLNNKLMKSDRFELIKLVKIYYIDFIQRLKEYKMNLNVNLKLFSNSEKIDPFRKISLDESVKERNDKIQKYIESKKYDTTLECLYYILKEKDYENLNDEDVRNFYLTLIRKWVFNVEEEMKLLNLEETMLEKNDSLKFKPKNKPTQPKYRPFIITKNQLQKQVFGLGYPSRPTVTIEEFVNQKIEQGDLSVTSSIYENSLQRWAEDPETKKLEDETDEEKKEKLCEKDDQEYLIKERERDDWKDDNKRGSGNRHNMG